MKAVALTLSLLIPLATADASDALDRWKESHAAVEQHKAEARYKRDRTQAIQDRNQREYRERESLRLQRKILNELEDSK